MRVLNVRCGCVRTIRLGAFSAYVGAVFSPDSSRVLIERADLSTSDGADVAQARLPGGRLRRWRFSALPLWGPPGLAFRDGAPDGPHEPAYAKIVVLRAPSSHAREVLRGEPSLSDPVAWSPDGRLLLADRAQHGQNKAFLLDVATGIRQALPAPFTTDDTELDPPPVAGLSRDGHFVLGQAGSDVIVQRLDGEVTLLAHEAVAPTWTR